MYMVKNRRKYLRSTENGASPGVGGGLRGRGKKGGKGTLVVKNKG